METGSILRWCWWKHPKCLEIKIETSQLLTRVNFSLPQNLRSSVICAFSMLWSIMYQHLKYKQQHLYSKKRKGRKTNHPAEWGRCWVVHPRKDSLNALSQNDSEGIGSVRNWEHEHPKKTHPVHPGHPDDLGSNRRNLLQCDEWKNCLDECC